MSLGLQPSVSTAKHETRGQNLGIEPIDQTIAVHCRYDRNVLQMGFCQISITGLSQSKRLHTLGQRSFNSRSSCNQAPTKPMQIRITELELGQTLQPHAIPAF